MMLDTGPREPVAERQQKIVVIEVTGTVKLVCLPHQFAVDLKDLRTHFEELRLVRYLGMAWASLVLILTTVGILVAWGCL